MTLWTMFVIVPETIADCVRQKEYVLAIILALIWVFLVSVVPIILFA